jgi:hypothetical protein
MCLRMTILMCPAWERVCINTAASNHIRFVCMQAPHHSVTLQKMHISRYPLISRCLALLLAIRSMEAVSVKDPLRWGSFPRVELSDCAAAAAAWSPDGSWLLSVATSSLGNDTYTSTLKICGGQDDASAWSASVSRVDLSPSTPQQLWAASWSPNAQWAAAVSSVPTMQLWGGSSNPTTWNTTAQKELTGLSAYSVGISWSPNGQWLASGSATANGVLGNVLLWRFNQPTGLEFYTCHHVDRTHCGHQRGSVVARWSLACRSFGRQHCTIVGWKRRSFHLEHSCCSHLHGEYGLGILHSMVTQWAISCHR